MEPQIEIQELKKLMSELIASQQETKERFKDLEERFKDTDAFIRRVQGQFSSQWGKLIESLVEGDLINLLKQRGILISETSKNRSGKDFEFDIIAHNGVEIVIVEVKTTLKVSDVDYFLSKLYRAKEWMQEYRDYEIYGCVAFLKSDEGSEKYAERSGLFVIRATGDSASIVNGEDFVPTIF